MNLLAEENKVVDISKLTSKFFRRNTIPDNQLAEIYSANASMPEISLVSEDGRQIGPWVKCKDFIQDVFWSQANKVSYAIYGYNYNPTVEPIPFSSHFACALRWKGKTDEQMRGYALNICRTIDMLEADIPWLDADGKKHSSIPSNLRSIVLEPNSDGVILIFGNRVWKRCIANISFFTWLVRSAFNNTSGVMEEVVKGAPNKKDVYYFNSAKKYVKALRSHGPQHFEHDFFKYTDVNGVHNNGFVRYSGGSGY